MPRRACLAMLLAVGCFGERTSSTDCPEGEPGCPCAPSGCDPGLVCESSIDLCIPENCIPGSELCTCNEGLCLTGLQCDGKLCRPGEGSETIAPTSEVDGSTLATTSSEPATSSETTGMSTDNACRACIVESNAIGGACEFADDACALNPVCTDLAGCVEECVGADDPECISGCCMMFPAGAPEYAAVGSCNANACSQQCGAFGLYCPT